MLTCKTLFEYWILYIFPPTKLRAVSAYIMWGRYWGNQTPTLHSQYSAHQKSFLSKHSYVLSLIFLNKIELAKPFTNTTLQ